MDIENREVHDSICSDAIIPQRKIIFINRYFHPDISATSQLLSDLAFYLAGEGLQVHVVTSQQRYDDPNAVLHKSEMVNGVLVSRVWSSRFGRNRLVGRALDYFTFSLSATWRLIKLAKPGDIIVAETDPPLISVVAMTAARMRRARLVNWLQDLFPEVAGTLGIWCASGIMGSLLRRMRNRTLRHARMNVVVGREMQQRVMTEARVGASQVTVIENWADGELIYPIKPEENSFRKLWRLNNHFVVGYSGNMGRVHEFETVLNAAKALQKDRRFTFLFVGDGAQRQSIEDQVREWGLTNVMMLPYQPKSLLAQSLSAPDVHFITMRAGMRGLVLLSKFYGIAAAGRPVIFIGDVTSEIPQVIEKAKCGVAVQRGDGDALVDHLVRLDADPQLREEMGLNARRLFEMKYQKPLALRAWKDLLGNLISNGS
jgi:glycosyltransferase involved in cell wall biosynthesis